MKPYKIGGTIADNVLKYQLGAYNEHMMYSYQQLPNNIISFAAEKRDMGLHPTQKPLMLMKYLVELVSIKNQLILDPFSGSGSTLLACKELGRNFIGFEKNKEFYEIAVKRLHKEITLSKKDVSDCEEQALF